MQCKCKISKYNFSIVRSVSVHPVNKIAFKIQSGTKQFKRFVYICNVHVVRLPSTTAAKHPERTTTAEFHPGRATLEVDQGHVTKNQPINVLV